MQLFDPEWELHFLCQSLRKTQHNEPYIFRRKDVVELQLHRQRTDVGRLSDGFNDQLRDFWKINGQRDAAVRQSGQCSFTDVFRPSKQPELLIRSRCDCPRSERRQFGPDNHCRVEFRREP